MKLVDVILLSLAAVFVIIGIYEVMQYGFGHAYWAISLSFAFFFIYTYRKKNNRWKPARM
jgi:predicted membrane protein